MKKQRLLTKSRFKQALDCPTKLYYTKKSEYENIQDSDPFLESLAQGGFQVEELARMYFPDGIAILGEDWNYQSLADKTQELLLQENITIFEAAFLINDLFIRVDILHKQGNNIRLIEVKAKSINATSHNSFLNKSGGMGGWTSYLYDVAFQKYVMQLCYPDWKISCELNLANKDAVASVNGLNQLFRITQNSDLRTGIIKPDSLTIDDLGEPILAYIDINQEIEHIHTNNPLNPDKSFEELVNFYLHHYKKDIKIFTPIGHHCKGCEFHTTPTPSQKSGFHECWAHQLNLSETKIDSPKTYEVNNFRGSKKLMNEEEKFFMHQLTENDLSLKLEAGKISTSERQLIQIEKENNNDTTPHIEIEGLRDEINSWIYPLNFIDFETSAVAIPFTKGRTPYEQTAFQFSHHIVYEDGRIEHFSEYLNTSPGEFPNFDFIRALKKSLESNNGSIFRYHNHENTIVNAIYKQLLNSNEPDTEELLEFIKSISHNTGNSSSTWSGERDMIDLWKVVKDYYYDPYTKGSNSIKSVLPATLNSSTFLQNKYSKPIKDINLTSKNFPDDFTFLKMEENQIINPYKILPPLFNNWTDEQLEQTISELDEIANGGAALVAYAKLQYQEMSSKERNEIKKGLLKYCELDTLAMVMIYEYFMEVIN